MQTAVLFCALALAAGPVTPLARWDGTSQNAELKKHAPASGFFADKAAFEKVWQAWRPTEKVPDIDFSKELVIVGVTNGPNRLLINPVLEDSGNVKFVVGSTLIGGPGFGYAMLKIDRTGVKTVNGQPIEAIGVSGVVVVPDKVATFADHALEVKLWEYDPRLADAAAKMVDELRGVKFSHTEGKPTEVAFLVGGKLEPRADRGYYITVFVLKDDARTHIGELDGKSGLTKVLEGGKASQVKMVVRAVR